MICVKTMWALVNSDRVVVAGGQLKVFTSKKQARSHQYLAGDRLVKVKISELEEKNS